MLELLKQQMDLMQKNNILICYFSVKHSANIYYRFYFKDMKCDYIYNPLSIKDEKAHYHLYNSFEEGLSEMIEKANAYLKN